MNDCKIVTIRFRREHHAAFQAAADQRALSLTAWVTQACLSYEMKNTRFVKAKQAVQQPLCTTCGQRHAVEAPHGKIRQDAPWRSK